jgi:uncharacterized pyridoxamine 5'-phosphate oxidase family protein
MVYSQPLTFIKSLLALQKFAVVSTHSCGQPYCNLVAFAETEDIKNLIFVTNRNTSKYKNLNKDSRVSLLIDNRTNLLADFGSARAVTVIGNALELPPESHDYYGGLFLGKHPTLADFVNDSNNSLFSVRVTSYILAGFEKVEKVEL